MNFLFVNIERIEMLMYIVHTSEILSVWFKMAYENHMKRSHIESYTADLIIPKAFP